MNGKGDKPRPVNRERYEENKKDPLSLKHEDERNKKR
jgi:hypothetical protein